MTTNKLKPDPLQLRYGKETVLGVIIGIFPFILEIINSGLALLFTVILVTPNDFGKQIVNFLISSGITVYMGIYIAGWLKGFPRWWFPYVLFIFLFTLFMSNASTPGLILFGYDNGREIWGWRAWLPVGIASVITILLSLHKKPLHQFLHVVWHDPSRISFAFYGLSHFLYFIFFDEVNSTYELPFMLFNGITLALFAVLYLRQSDPLKRLGLLYGGSMLVWIVNTIGLAVYWDGRKEFWMKFPATWMDHIPGMIFFFAVFSFCYLVPVWVINFIRTMKREKKLNP